MSQEIICLDSSSEDEEEMAPKIKVSSDDIKELDEKKIEPEIITLDDDDENESENETLDPHDLKIDENTIVVVEEEIQDGENEEEEEIEIDPNERRTKLFINYLPQDLSDEELNAIFMKMS